MTRAFNSTTRRRVELVPVGDLPQDEHAFCPCGGLMAYVATGVLVCADCGTRSQAEPKSWEPTR